MDEDPSSWVQTGTWMWRVGHTHRNLTIRNEPGDYVLFDDDTPDVVEFGPFPTLDAAKVAYLLILAID